MGRQPPPIQPESCLGWRCLGPPRTSTTSTTSITSTTSASTTTTMGPTTTTEVRPGMNLCNPLMKKKGYEINMVICSANEICQPLSSNGELAKVGYVVFSSF